MNIFEADNGAMDWNWDPAEEFTYNQRYVWVTHVAIELGDDAGAAGAVEVRLVDGKIEESKSLSDYFNILVGSSELNNRSWRIIQFNTPLLVAGDQSLNVAYANPSDRSIKAVIVTYL